MDPLALVRKAAVLPGLRRLTTVTPVIRATGALRGGLVHEHLRFALNELRPRDVVVRYSLRSSDWKVVIRHHTSDVLELDMAFSGGEFDPPPEAAAILDSIAEPRAVDLGANIGLFGVWLLQRNPNAHLISYEPDPGNAAVLERIIAINGVADHWTHRRVAAAPADGTISFAAGHGTTSRVVDASESGTADVITVEARDPFGDLATADVVKIDIEGGEWGLLPDPRFATLPARVICVEYHLRAALSADPGADAERMVRAGGWVVRHELRENMPGHGLVWGWRP